MPNNKYTAFRRRLMGAASVIAAMTAATNASAQAQPDFADVSPDIIIRNDLDPNALPPAGDLDSGITGIGQMTIRPNPATTGMSVCTGTLINPRTVIFAAHCVNSRPAEAYGSNGIANGLNPNGTPIAFGFDADNLPAVRQWLGLDGGPRGETNLAKALYAVEQVWYDPRSRAPASCTSATSCFLQADIAIATLDTPAFDIPTWAMLFSPLDAATHVTIAGYGNAGRANSTSIGIDWRRRTAENMLAVLGSLNDRNLWLFGTGSAATNNLYLYDFDDPAGVFNPAVGAFDFNLYGADTALPREGTTAGGDSGGPLIVDQKYDRPVTVAVLSGGTRYFGGQAGHNYGTDSFYQPLFLYWDQIVANNPYVYAGNKAGSGAWEDLTHWLQLMDPSYMIDVNGVLVNALPDTPAQGIAPGGAKFGQLCFLGDCDTPLTGSAPVGDGTPIFIPGGPGSTNFVPNNVTANPKAGIKARYYDVTLAAPGTTTLSSSVTIDRMTLDGETRLDIKANGALQVLGEYNQLQGWTHVDGLVESGRDMMILSGMLSGKGVVRAPFATVVGGIVAPGGGDKIGTLTIDGNLILASGSALFIDVQRGAADKLAVTGGGDNGILAIGGASLVFNKVTDKAAPRHGDTFEIASATGGITGTFGSIYSFQGVLRPELIYGANDITALIRAGSLVTILDGQNPTAVAFAGALDALRASSYNQLYGLYGAVDLMGGQELSATLNGLAPKISGETRSLQERQSRVMLSAVTDRLSALGTGTMRPGLSIVGTPGAMGISQGNPTPLQTGVASLVPNGATAKVLPKGVTGFVSGGVIGGASRYGDSRSNMQGQMTSHVSAGLEMEMAEGLTIGTAFGYAKGASAPGSDRTESKTSQVAFYGSYQLGSGAYLAGVASAETSRATLERHAATGNVAFDLYGATNSSRYNAMAEAGVNLTVARGLTLTPRARLGYDSYQLGGFGETGGETALRMDDLRLNRLEGRMGAKLAGARSVGGGWTIVPQLQADYVQLLSGTDSGMRVRFANAGDHVFALPLAGGDSSWTEARGGLRLSNGTLQFGLGFETAIGRSEIRDDRAVADIAVRF